ncbi:hypothetical protein GCM10023336_73680 [Streptomyces similanensis]|uniref:Uncharacterized protein n=1 Tax=Streptomyces similanensis TaxID=1274988 RepID=A0ABP9LKZ7_9ACTN
MRAECARSSSRSTTLPWSRVPPPSIVPAPVSRVVIERQAAPGSATPHHLSFPRAHRRDNRAAQAKLPASRIRANRDVVTCAAPRTALITLLPVG